MDSRLHYFRYEYCNKLILKKKSKFCYQHTVSSHRLLESVHSGEYFRTACLFP